MRCRRSSRRPNANLFYEPNQQQFQALNTPNSVFLNQNYLNLAGGTFLPLGFQPFGYPQSKNFVYAYSQQANLTVERDLGDGFALSLAYNLNLGRHLNRPINANTIRGDLMTANFFAASSTRCRPDRSASPFTVSGCEPRRTSRPTSTLPRELLPARRTEPLHRRGLLCQQRRSQLRGAGPELFSPPCPGFNTKCNPAPPTFDYTGCIPFGDMDANYSNGTSNYNGLTANLRKRFSHHYEFLASYTWSHAIDDSTDLQATLTPQDSYFPSADRSTSTFDQRHRFVFSGVYQSGRLSGDGFASKLFSNWTFAPLIEFGSGRPFNIITGNGDNLPVVFPHRTPQRRRREPHVTAVVTSRWLRSTRPRDSSRSLASSTSTARSLSLDGNLGRNAGVTPWTVFNDLRVAKRIYFGERFNMDLIADMFNIANRYNVAAVSPLFTNAGQATASYDPRQFQFALKLNW